MHFSLFSCFRATFSYSKYSGRSLKGICACGVLYITKKSLLCLLPLLRLHLSFSCLLILANDHCRVCKESEKCCVLGGWCFMFLTLWPCKWAHVLVAIFSQKCDDQILHLLCTLWTAKGLLIHCPFVLIWCSQQLWAKHDIYHCYSWVYQWELMLRELRWLTPGYRVCGRVKTRKHIFRVLVCHAVLWTLVNCGKELLLEKEIKQGLNS